jgi:hypothetical protein
MFQRRVADLWRRCADGVAAFLDWAQQYQELLQQLSDLAAHDAVPDAELRSRLLEIVAPKRAQRPPSRASVIRCQYRPSFPQFGRSKFPHLVSRVLSPASRLGPPFVVDQVVA